MITLPLDHCSLGKMPSAEELKKLGNEHYAAGRDAEALEAYTQALNLPDARPLLHVLHSNSSAAHLRLGQAEAALEAALRCREAKPDWAKGFFREAQALAALHRPGHAEAALRAGLERCGEDAALLIELEKVQVRLSLYPCPCLRRFKQEPGLVGRPACWQRR